MLRTDFFSHKLRWINSRSSMEKCLYCIHLDSTKCCTYLLNLLISPKQKPVWEKAIKTSRMQPCHVSRCPAQLQRVAARRTVDMQQVTSNGKVFNFFRPHGFHIDFGKWNTAICDNRTVVSHEPGNSKRQCFKNTRDISSLFFCHTMPFFLRVNDLPHKRQNTRACAGGDYVFKNILEHLVLVLIKYCHDSALKQTQICIRKRVQRCCRNTTMEQSAHFVRASETPANSFAHLSFTASGTIVGVGFETVCQSCANHKKPSPVDPVSGCDTPPVANTKDCAL